MSDSELRSPLLYPNWVWILGAVIFILTIVWVGGWLWHWHVSAAHRQLPLLTQGMRATYDSLLAQIKKDYTSGTLDRQGCALAVGALLRALASERTGKNYESATTWEIHEQMPDWPTLSVALEKCEHYAFEALDDNPSRVDTGRSSLDIDSLFAIAVEVIQS